MTYRINIAVPRPVDSWVWLPVAKPKRSGLFIALRDRGRDGDSDITEWAAAKARELLGTGADPQALRCHADSLARAASSGRKRGLKMAAVWIQKERAATVAQLEVSTWHLTRDDRYSLSLDMLERVFARRDSETAELEVSRLELPAGPAVRVRREWHQDGPGGSPEDAAVSVTYVCLPPQIKHAIVYMMYWVLADDFPELTALADSLAPTLRIIT